MVKDPPANAGDIRDVGLIPGSMPCTQVFMLQRAVLFLTSVFPTLQLHGALSMVSVGSWQSEPGKQVRADSLFGRGFLDSSLGLCCGNMGFPSTEMWTKGSRTDLSERKEHQRSSRDSPSKQVRGAQGTLTPPLQTAWT